MTCRSFLIFAFFISNVFSSCAKDSTTDNTSNPKSAGKEKNSSGSANSKSNVDCSKEDCQADEGSEVLSGMNLFGLTFENAAMHCKSSKNSDGSSSAKCDAYVKQSDGSEKKAEKIADATKIEWVYPVVTGVAVARIGACIATEDKLSYECPEIRTDTGVMLEFAVSFKKETKSRSEVELVSISMDRGPI